jgi:predicted nuclease of predicted toxin-antitoxin system
VKLLLDQNISYRLVKTLSAIYPDTEHVTKLGLINRTDREIWETAKVKGYTIVTFDADFYDLSLTQGIPPKVIWIRSGNTTTRNLQRLLTEKYEQILHFDADPIATCLEIDD